MKILLIGEKGSYTDSFIYAVKQLKCELNIYSINDFFTSMSFWQRKIYSLGWKDKLFIKFAKKQEKSIKSLYDKTKPNIVFFLGGCIVSQKTVDYMRQESKTAIWLIDSLKEKLFYNAIYHKLAWFNVIFTYEKDDVHLIQERFKKKTVFIPVGYDERFYKKCNTEHKDIDISFVGGRSDLRLSILEKAAEFAYKNRLKMCIYGITMDHESRHFWKKYIEKRRFLHKYPYLSNCLANIRRIPPQKTAEVYRSSKIVLNINRTASAAINPRTFEIMATNSFELMDSRKDYCGIVEPGSNMEIYNDAEDMVNKLDYYLRYEEKRNDIAEAGYNTVKEKYSMNHIVQEIFIEMNEKLN
ncbi:CgeB family protein [Pectinatus sottacetonis]|uniref:CgeB family protein n=1 Tax=Pectinatus sottacetonis TaxID=1002795 RepID=UPI0018C552FA|nr:glycosyltransferase [Pectinatus sottacetonis]